MNTSFKLFSLLVLAVVSLLLCGYSLVGVLQAAMLFSGERALRNYQLWGSASAIFLVLALWLFWSAWRLARQHRVAVMRSILIRRAAADEDE